MCYLTSRALLCTGHMISRARNLSTSWFIQDDTSGNVELTVAPKTLIPENFIPYMFIDTLPVQNSDILGLESRQMQIWLRCALLK